MPKSVSSFYNSNVSLDKAKNLVRDSLKALTVAGSTDRRISQECETPMLSGNRAEVYGWTPLLILTGAATTLGSSVPVGYTIGVMNTPAHIMKMFCNETFAARGIEMSEGGLDMLWSCIVSVFLVGGMLGSLCGSWVADRLGRKGAVAATSCLAVVAAIMFATSRPVKSVELLLLGRLTMGLSSGLTTSTVPMYLTEIAPLSIRGAMGVLCPLGLTVGVLLGQIMGLPFILGSESSWHYLLGLYAVLVIPTIIAIPFLPESPKYLYAIRGEIDRAVDELCRLRQVSLPETLSCELEELYQDCAVGTVWGVSKVLRASELYLPLALVCAMQAGQQFSGINAVFYYSVTIFESAGLSKAGSQYATICAGGVNLLVTIIAVPLLNRCGRRKLILVSCWLATLCLVLLAGTITFIDAVPWMAYVCIMAVLSYVFTYGFGLGPIPYFIGSELFMVGPRPVAMAFGSMSNWAGNFIVGMTFPSLQTAIGPYSFLIFASTTLLLSVFLKWHLPETRGRTPAQVADDLQGGLHRKSKRVIPSDDSVLDSDLMQSST